MDSDTHTIEKKKIAAESPIYVNGCTIIAIAETWIIGYGMRYGISYIGRKTPLALVAAIHGEKKAYRASGGEISIDELVKEYPAIKEAVAELK